MPKYTIGIDFGTLSGRAVLVDTATGAEIAQAVYDYPHAVIDRALPGGAPLGVDWALQHPEDYLGVFYSTLPALLRQARVSADDIIGLGIDFTACTFMPITRDGTPLCLLPQFAGEPHAWVKLWKHHAAQDQANRLNDLAHARGEAWIGRYGGKISSEWQVPKVLQVLEEAPHIYAAAGHFIEAADWVVWALTGRLTKNTCTAGYKGIWSADAGYPDADFFAALHPGLKDYVADKLDYPLVRPGQRVGGLTAEMARRTGLRPGTAVAAANVDAHVTMAAVGADRAGIMLAIMGTSTCHILLGDREHPAPGMCGVVRDGVFPGFFGYEAGQSCVGDHFAWLAEKLLPGPWAAEAAARGMTPHALLDEKAARLHPGESGLLALDWWNGNRSVLVDVELSGLILGMGLQTAADEIYRALLEATAYGTRKIIETFRQSGVPVDAFIASGGIAQKNPLAMQIYADVLGMPVRVGASPHGPALGSAIFAAVAAGKAAGGWDDIFEVARHMGRAQDTAYVPDPQATAVYNALYAEYDRLHDYFGRGENNVMKRLKSLRKSAKGETIHE